ncbi:MAG: cytochrome P450, partial [Polyangiaceae bacterium]
MLSLIRVVGTGIELKSEPSLSGLGSLVRYSNRPLKRFEDARSFSARASAYELLGTYTQVIFDPELIETVLIGNHAAFSKDAFVRDLGQVLGEGLLNSEGEAWRRQRKLAAPSFQRTEIANYAEQMVECTERFLRDLKEDEPFDVHAGFMHLTLDILVRTLFGTQISRVREVEAALDSVMAEYSPLRMALRVALPPWVSSRSRRRIARLRSALDSVLLELIAERKADQRAGSDLLSRLLAAGDAQGGLSDAQLRDETMTLFLAGHETTALTLTYTLRLLALHPAIAERTQREVRQVLDGRTATLSDLPALPFTRAVLNESLRLFPPAWGMTREAIGDCELGEFACPAGTQVIVVPWVMHRDQRFFERPELFHPERWLTPPELPRCVYMPFGAGPRVCIGNHFALTEALLVLASCLAHGEFRLCQGPLLKLSPAITLRPSGP